MSVRHLSVLGTMFVCAVATAGDLNPPPGAVSPTMLPLDRIEPRVCVNDLAGSADAMHVITQPGVYFVGADIAAGPGMSAIVIDVAPGLVGQVVLDLGGFTLHGAGGGGGASGVKVPPQAGPIYVLSPNSGRIANFGGHGIEVLGTSQVSIDGVNIADCAGDGVHIVNATEVAVSVDVRDCAGNGVTVMQSGAVSIADTTVANTGADGVHVVQVGACVISAVGIAGTLGDGIDVVDVDYMAIKECVLPASWKYAQLKKHRNQSRVAGSGGNGVVITDCGTIEIEELLIDGAGGNGVTLLAPQVISSAVIRRMHVRDTIDALYAENLRSVEVIDWRDEDSDDDGIDIVGIAGGAPGEGVYTISDAASERALGNAISVTGPGGGAGAGSVSISDARAVGTGDTVIVAKMQRVELARVIADGGGIAPVGVEIDAVDATLRDVHATRAAGPGASVVVSGALTVSGFVSERNVGGGFHGAGTGSGKASMLDFRMSDNGAGGVGGATADGALFLEFDTIVLHNGESSGNSGSGLRIIDLNRDGRLDLVTCSANGADGVSVESPSGVGAGRVVVSNGAFGSNGADGLFLEATTGGQIVDCTATNNAGWGIRVLGSNHLIQRNACLGNFGGSLLAAAPGNIVGPMVSEFTVGANTNPAANYE